MGLFSDLKASAGWKAAVAAPNDIKYAKVTLLIMAGYIERGEPLPIPLQARITRAIQEAVLQPEKADPDSADTGQALLFALHLKSHNRRPANVDGEDIHQAMKELISPKMSQNKAAKIVGDRFGISVTTVKRLFRETEEDHAEAEQGWLDMTAHEADRKALVESKGETFVPHRWFMNEIEIRQHWIELYAEQRALAKAQGLPWDPVDR
jgi:hypothetical protein